MNIASKLIAVPIAVVVLLIVVLSVAGPVFRWNVLLTIYNTYDDLLSDYTPPIERLNKAEERLRNNPSDAEAWFDKGLALKNKETREEALAAADRAIALDPEQEKYHWLKCFAAFSLYEPERALVILEDHAAMFPKRSEPWYWMYFVYNKMDNYEKSVMCYKRVAELEPNDAGNYGFLASTMLSGGEIRESLPYFDKALELLGDISFYKVKDRVIGAMFSSDKALSLTLLGRHEQAMYLIEKANKLNPNDTSYIVPLVYANVALGYPDRAVNAVKHAHYSGPNENRIHAYALLSRNNKGDHDRAMGLLNKALDQAAEKDNVLTYALMGERDKAFELMVKVCAENPHLRQYYRLAPELAKLRDDPRFAAIAGT